MTFHTSSAMFLPNTKQQDQALLRVGGYASVFLVRDHHDDIVMPGAFGTIEDPSSVKLLWQHHHETPVGIIRTLQEDAYGLRMEADILLESAYGKEAATLITGGALSGLSIGYRVLESETDQESNTRLLTKAELWEISFVTFPANPQTHVTDMDAMPATTEDTHTVREREKALRREGHSQKSAKRMIAEERRDREYTELTALLKESIKYITVC